MSFGIKGMNMIKKVLSILGLTAILMFLGCGGEANYSFDTVQQISNITNLINGEIKIVSNDKVFVEAPTQDVTVVKTDSVAKITYSIIGGEDSERFSIDPLTGKLTLISKPAYINGGDNLYEVIVSSEDTHGNRAVQVLEVEIVADIKNINPLISTTLKNYAVLTFDGVVLGIDAQPADAQSTLTYKIEGVDSALFSIDTKGDLRFNKEAAIASAKSSFTIDIVVTDGYSNETRLSSVQIEKVNAINEIKPVVLSETFSIVENSLGNVDIEVYKAPGAEIEKYLLSGGDATLFEVSSAGVLTLKTPMDFESTTRSFNFGLQVEDSNGQRSLIKTIIVSIVNIDEQFHFSGIRDLAVQEGVSGVLTQIDAEVNTISDGIVKQFVLVQGAESFSIDTDGVIRFKEVAQKGAIHTLQVSVESQYNGSSTLSDTFSVTVVDDPTKIAPTIDNNYPRAVEVRAPINTANVVTTIIAVVGGSATNLSYNVEGAAAALFSVDAEGLVRFRNAINFIEGADNIYEFSIAVTDEFSNKTVSDLISVTLLQDFDKIRPAILSTTFNILENSTSDMNVLFSSDGTGVINNYSIVGGSDQARFLFEAGKLRFKLPVDHESNSSVADNNSFNVQLQVSDDKGNVSDIKSIIVNVNDVDETLQFISLNTFTPLEGSTEVGTIIANGKDNAVVTVTYTLTNHTDLFVIDANSGLLSFKTPAVYQENNSHFELLIEAESQLNGSLTRSPMILVDITPISNAITFTPQGVANLDQNTMVQVPIEATSASNRTLTYSMQAGTDSTIFSIDAVTGIMSVNVPAYIYSNDPEANIYRGAVVASDNFGNSATQQGELHVNAVDGMPQFITPEAITVNENTKVIVQLEAHSPIGSNLVYEKELGADGFYFDVSSNGALSFSYEKNFEDPLDANRDNVYEVDIRVTDAQHSTNSIVKRFLVQVLDLSDAPSNVLFANTNSIYTTVADGVNNWWPIPDSNKVTYLTINATPSPSNGYISSTIVSNPNSSIFSMSSNMVLKVDAPPVSSDTGFYEIVVEISEDKGESTQVSLFVKILD